MATDDDDAWARLEQLEAEVKNEAEVSRRRKAEAVEQVRTQRQRVHVENLELTERQTALVARKRRADRGDDLGDALALARKAASAKKELSRPRQAGDKSWLISGGASFLLGPLGWLYAGAWREAVPASLFYVLAAAIVSKILPAFLLMPVLMVVLPLSGIAGVVYAIGHNRNQHRIRLFGEEAGDESDRRIGKLGAGRDDDE